MHYKELTPEQSKIRNKNNKRREELQLQISYTRYRWVS